MGKTVYYDKLIKAANKKGKSELEVYESVNNCVNDILKDQEDKCLMLRTLLAYVEGKTSNSWYVAMMAIAYTLIVGATSLMPSAGIDSEKMLIMVVALVVCAWVAAIVAWFNSDFEKKMVICVLNDKLEECAAESEVDVNVTAIMVEDKKDKKKKSKGKKKNKKKNRTI